MMLSENTCQISPHTHRTYKVDLSGDSGELDCVVRVQVCHVVPLRVVKLRSMKSPFAPEASSFSRHTALVERLSFIHARDPNERRSSEEADADWHVETFVVSSVSLP